MTRIKSDAEKERRSNLLAGSLMLTAQSAATWLGCLSYSTQVEAPKGCGCSCGVRNKKTFPIPIPVSVSISTPIAFPFACGSIDRVRSNKPLLSSTAQLKQLPLKSC